MPPVKSKPAPKAKRTIPVESIVTPGDTLELPATARGKYPWHTLVKEGSYFVIAGATRKRPINVPKGAGYTVRQSVLENPVLDGEGNIVRPSGLAIIRVDRKPKAVDNAAASV